ncbi:MAG: BAX inhibitor (BI)-1/YccA family protein, partial [Pseudomonadota bacterium]
MQDKSVYNMNNAAVESAISTNKVLKNTYMLLGLTLLFSAVTAGISIAVGLSQGAALVLFLVGFGLLFVVNRTADS